MIFGIGTDIIEVERVKKQIEKENGFKEKIFTKKEIEYCEKKRFGEQNFAARFAGKEAFLKAIGMGWRDGLAFNEIEILNNDLGKPEIFLYGKARKFTEKNNITKINISLSHIKNLAIAFVIIEHGECS